MRSVSITTNIVSSNTIHGEVYTIQHYVIKFVSDLRQVGSEILLKVALNTKILNPSLYYHDCKRKTNI
jgi:gamma-glutamylcyclotransferase (GGCT)/AIG2-like uncharacterized protein YtfP